MSASFRDTFSKNQLQNRNKPLVIDSIQQDQYSLFTVDTSVLGDKVPRDQAFLASFQVYHAPPVGFGIVHHFHSIALDEADVGFLAGIVVVKGDHYPSGVETGVNWAGRRDDKNQYYATGRWNANVVVERIVAAHQ